MAPVDPPSDAVVPPPPPLPVNCGEDDATSDEDGDLISNATDNCPHVANVDQANTAEAGAGGLPDGLGDACDSDPAPQYIRRFIPFCSAAELDQFAIHAGMEVVDGAVRMAAVAPPDASLLLNEGKTGMLIASFVLAPNDELSVRLQSEITGSASMALCDLHRLADGGGGGGINYHHLLQTFIDGIPQVLEEFSVPVANEAFALKLFFLADEVTSCDALNAQGVFSNANRAAGSQRGMNTNFVHLELTGGAQLTSLLLACNGDQAACAAP